MIEYLKDLSDSELSVRMMGEIGKMMKVIESKTGDLMLNIGFSIPEFTVLELLYKYKKITLEDLALKAGTSAENISLIINNIKIKGLIANNSDTYGLTTAGVIAMKKIFNDQSHYLTSLFSVLDKEDKIKFIELANKLQGI